MKRSEKTELTVSKIMEAAMAEFGTNGYVGNSVNNICEYFSSSAYWHMSLDEQVNEQETSLPKLLDFMLYGISKGG